MFRLIWTIQTPQKSGGYSARLLGAGVFWRSGSRSDGSRYSLRIDHFESGFYRLSSGIRIDRDKPSRPEDRAFQDDEFFPSLSTTSERGSGLHWSTAL